MASEPRTERVYFNPPPPVQMSETWWSRYSAELAGLTLTARAALEADSRYILERGVFGAGEPDPLTWPQSRVRTGLVMGSVQSGKTASMLGVTALALDEGIDIVVVLAGTRLSLWRQTYERLLGQLDAGDSSAQKSARRLLCPMPGVVLSEDSKVLSVTYRMAPAAVRKKLSDGKPLIVVAMKQTDHLHALSGILRKNVFSTIAGLGRPVHMLVLDDEADDGSVLDAVVEVGRDPIFGKLKQIPRAIANLWNPSEPAPDNLFTTYIGYTATPQANLLQEDHNPLAPRDFVVSLRTPLDIGQLIDPTNPGDLAAPRSSTYPEPVGHRAYYTGGEIFYRRGASAGLCVETTSNPSEDLADSVRAFLVASAVRLYRSGKSGPFSASLLTYDTEDEAAASTSPPSSMLFHPSSNILDQFRGAEDVLIWAGAPDRDTARAMLESGSARLPDALVASLRAAPSKWEVWLDRYKASAREIETEFNLQAPVDMPDWLTVSTLLEDEVIPGTRVSVVNSDTSADDRPAYRPMLDEATGRWLPARDLSTIFVSGNVMARGLTLEGLTTALFQRTSNNPLADTQMQMQRWFGYRGSFIELCRVFADPGQLDLFRAYHDVDEAVRIAITERMAGGAPEPAVLQGVGFLATGKIANLGNRPLSPGARPFIKLVNDGASLDPNTQIVADLFTVNQSVDLTVGGTLRGRILDRPLSLTEAADALSQLTYAAYQPGTNHQLGLLWAQVEARVAAVQPLPVPGLYRAPQSSGVASDVRQACPYGIPAYFRLWDACLTRAIRGLFITGEPAALWSMADLSRKHAEQPRFWVGIRYGRGAPVTEGPLATLPFPIQTTMKNVHAGELTTTWGANDPTAGPDQYRGDEYFDYYYRNMAIPRPAGDSSWRPPGSDGQILFYVNQHPGQAHPVVAVGICIPAGGPEQFAATRASIPVT